MGQLWRLVGTRIAGLCLNRSTDPRPFFFEDQSLDVIYAWSVFSHLSEETHLPWLAEFERVLKPGGAFLSTLCTGVASKRQPGSSHLQTNPLLHMTEAISASARGVATPTTAWPVFPRVTCGAAGLVTSTS